MPQNREPVRIDWFFLRSGLQRRLSDRARTAGPPSPRRPAAIWSAGKDGDKPPPLDPRLMKAAQAELCSITHGGKPLPQSARRPSSPEWVSGTADAAQLVKWRAHCCSETGGGGRRLLFLSGLRRWRHRRTTGRCAGRFRGESIRKGVQDKKSARRKLQGPSARTWPVRLIRISSSLFSLCTAQIKDLVKWREFGDCGFSFQQTIPTDSSCVKLESFSTIFSVFIKQHLAFKPFWFFYIQHIFYLSRGIFHDASEVCVGRRPPARI